MVYLATYLRLTWFYITLDLAMHLWVSYSITPPQHASSRLFWNENIICDHCLRWETGMGWWYNPALTFFIRLKHALSHTPMIMIHGLRSGQQRWEDCQQQLIVVVAAVVEKLEAEDVDKHVSLDVGSVNLFATSTWMLTGLLGCMLGLVRQFICSIFRAQRVFLCKVTMWEHSLM